MATTNAQSAYVIFMKPLRFFIKTNLIDAKHFPISYIKVGSAAITDTGCAKGAIDWALRPTDGLLKNTCASGAIC